MVLTAGEPEHQGFFLHVHHFGMEQLCQVGQFFPHLRSGGADLDHGQFVADKRRVVQVHHLDHVDELGQLLDGLVQLVPVLYGHHDVDPGHVPFFRIAGIDELDIDGPAADESGYMGQDPGLVVGQDGQMLSDHGWSPPVTTISSSFFPPGTMG